MPYPDKQAIFSRIKELLLHYVFSFKGFANGLQFGIATSIAFISNDILSKLDVSLTIRNFIYGYIMLVAFQKRCRDINIKGTLIIIFITLAFFYVAIFEALKLDMYGYLDTTSKFFLHAYAFLVLTMMILPSSQIKNAELTSPLLKYPYLYVLVCIGICLWGISVVSEHQDEIIRAVT